MKRTQAFALLLALFCALPFDAAADDAATVRKRAGWTSPQDSFDHAQAPALDALVAASLGAFSPNEATRKALRALQAKRRARLVGHVKTVDPGGGPLGFDTLYNAYAKRVGSTKYGPHEVGGFTDKMVGEVVLKRGSQSGASTVEAAVHEAIHQLAHPAGAAGSHQGSFRGNYGNELDEGVTQYFTHRVLRAAGFKPHRPLRYPAELKEVEVLLAQLGPGALDALATSFFFSKGPRLHALTSLVMAKFGAKVARGWASNLRTNYLRAKMILRLAVQLAR